MEDIIDHATNESRLRTVSCIALTAALASVVYAANWAVQEYGIVNVGFGLEGPAGVWFAGLAFAFRDMLHELGGKLWVGLAILIGGIVSYVVSDAITLPGGNAPLAIASAGAFLMSELADFAVYTPLRQRRWVLASMSSNVVGAVVDSWLFLWLAFGTIEHWQGQVVAKVYVTIPMLLLLWWARRHRDRSQDHVA